MHHLKITGGTLSANKESVNSLIRIKVLLKSGGWWF